MVRTRRLTADEAPLAMDVLADAFAGYPVMRWVLGTDAPPEDPSLRRLVHLFVMARVLREDVILGAEQDGAVVGIATVTLPREREQPPAFQALKDEVWRELGDAARERYEAYGRAAARHAVEAPHHHLNMIGVRRERRGRGLARPLLEAVHGLEDGDPASAGVSLATEVERNVRLYEHFGYRVLGRATAGSRGAGLETWAMFRGRDISGGGGMPPG